MQTQSVSAVAELIGETLNQAASGRQAPRIAGDEFEVGSIVSADLDHDSSDIEIEINGRFFRLLVTDITSEVIAHRESRKAVP